MKNKYPLLKKLKIPHSKKLVSWADLEAGLIRNKINRDLFDKYFGIQTCPTGGCYPWDCEAVLERVINKKLIGSQKYWD